MHDMYPFIPSPYAPKPKPTHAHAHSFTLPPTSALYTPIPLSHHPHNHASSSRSSASTPPTPLTPLSPRATSHGSYTTGKRPKLAKKAHSSTAKQRGVQASLEGQVDKYKGWQAFFLPPKPLPSVPPCSPVLGATRVAHAEMEEEADMHLDAGDESDLSRSTSNSSHCPQQQCAMGLPSGFGTEAMQLQQMQMGQMMQRQVAGVGQNAKGKDYFGQWKKREEWVEDVDVEAMDLDMA